jgi:hypothetical protein
MSFNNQRPLVSGLTYFLSATSHCYTLILTLHYLAQSQHSTSAAFVDFIY